VIFNFSDWKFRQVLIYLGNKACLHIGMECVSQISERSWWSHHDESLRLGCPNHMFHGRGDPLREAVLFDVMPIGRLDSASAASWSGLTQVPWPVAALLMSRWIFLLKDLLDPEIRRYRVAIISQEQGLSAIADKHQGIMRNLEVVLHVVLPAVLLRRICLLASGPHAERICDTRTHCSTIETRAAAAMMAIAIFCFRDG